MKSLNLPRYSFRYKKENDSDFIFDDFRRKYVRLTPEEWVRQNFAMYLVEEKNYPRTRIVLEKSLTYNKMSKRCDILVYDEYASPAVMVECKAPGIKINRNAFDQISVYNMVFRVKYLIVTNGISHYCCRIDFDERKVEFLDQIPVYESIDGSFP